MPGKKILMLNYEFIPLGGGASPVSYEIAKGYVKMGYQVDVITMGYKNLPFFEVKEGINIYRLKCWRTKKEICHPWEQWTYIYVAKKFLKKHLRNNFYDINHTHFIIPTGIVSLWLKKKYGLEYIVTSHGSDVLGYNKKREFKYLYPFIANPWLKVVKEAKYLVTPSKFLQEEIKKITKDGNFKIIPNGIDFEKFRPAKKEKRILVVARFFVNKGVQNILDAIKDLDLINRGWCVDIVGDGPYRNFLEGKVRENRLEKVVNFHGWIDNDSVKIRKLYSKSSIFISASWFENMSVVLLEALASGCNIIASNVGGNPEIVSKDNLFEVRNVDDLRSKIERAISSYCKINKVGDLEDFKWEVILKRYDSLLETRKRVLALACMPFYQEKGSSLRLYSILKIISTKYDIDLVTYSLGKDVEIKNIKIIKTFKFFKPYLGVNKPSFAKIILDLFVFLKALKIILFSGKKYHALHCEDFEAAILGKILNIFVKGRMIYSLHNRVVHNWEISGRKMPKLINHLERGVIKSSDLLIANWMMYLKDSAFKEKKIFLHYDSVSSVIEKVKLPCKDYLFYSGNFEEYQGVHEFLKMYKKSKSNKPIILAGDPSENILRFVKKEELVDKVTFVGRRSVEETNFFIKNSCACILPRISGIQPSMKMIHYLMWEKPVIAKNLSCNRELIKEGYNGFLYNEEMELRKILTKIDDEKELQSLHKGLVETANRIFKLTDKERFLKKYET